MMLLLCWSCEGWVSTASIRVILVEDETLEKRAEIVRFALDETQCLMGKKPYEED
jgi:hypothetical protein